MLSDFLALEKCYGRIGSVLYIDEILELYGVRCVSSALNKGHLALRRICIGPDCGRDMCWLTEDGRQAGSLSVY